jgi:hypothetical protein
VPVVGMFVQNNQVISEHWLVHGSFANLKVALTMSGKILAKLSGLLDD